MQAATKFESTKSEGAAASMGSRLALAAFVGLALTIAMRGGKAAPSDPDGLARVGAVLGVVMHVALGPVVAKLPAPRWARRAGYAWLAADIVANVLTLGATHDATTTTIRLVGHLPAAAWIATAANSLPPSGRRVGYALAAWLGGYTLAAPVIPDAAFMPAVPLMIAWLGIVSRELSLPRAD